MNARHGQFNIFTLPRTAAVTYAERQAGVPDRPIIPFIGDGNPGLKFMAASRVIDAAVKKAYQSAVPLPGMKFLPGSPLTTCTWSE